MKKKIVVVKLKGLSLGFFRIVRGCPGLGNHLFTIYKAYQYTKSTNSTFVWPTTRQISNFLRTDYNRNIGQYLVRTTPFEKVQELVFAGRRRHYLLGFIFRDVVLFQNNSNLRLDSVNKDVLRYFVAEIKDRNRFRSCQRLCTAVCVHIRLGDFRKICKSDSDFTNKSLPISWYIDQVNNLLRSIDISEIVIYSDDNIGVEKLIRCSQWPSIPTKISSQRVPIIALLEMSEYPVLIGSCSTFTLWSYIFSMLEQKVIVKKGFQYQKYLPFATFIEQ